MGEVVSLFVSYARKDRRFLDALLAHLSSLHEWENRVAVWSDLAITPGGEWSADLSNALDRADIVLCLLSRDLLASEFIRTVELARALERMEDQLCEVLPVRIRDIDLRGTPFEHLQWIPTGEPIRSPQNDRAWLEQVLNDVVQSERFFVARRAQEKRRAFYSSLSVSIAAAIATFAVGLGTAVEDLKTATTVVALAAGAVTTVLAPYESHWDHKRLWAYRTQIVFLIQQLHRSIDLYVGQPSPDEAPSEAVVRRFHERHESIREVDLTAWGRLRGVDFPDLGAEGALRG